MKAIEIDRLAMRARPPGTPVMHQSWEDLLFLHWPVDSAAVRPLIPDRLEIDTYEGRAWIGVTPFAMRNVHFTSLPPIPGLDSFLELNVRTYVHHEGKPGIWFFSLDASKLIPAIGARILFSLPYYKAEMNFAEQENDFHFRSDRSVSPQARFRAHWRIGVRLREPHLDSLAFFLVERYALFAGTNENLHMTCVYHHPWILDEAFVMSHESTLLKPLGISEPAAEPLAHFSRSLNVEVWAPAFI